MFIEFLKRNRKMAWFLGIVRFLLGWTWFWEGYGKMFGKNFDATKFLQAATEKTTGAEPVVRDWWAFVIKYFFLPNVEVLNYLIPVSEFFIGLALMLGAFTRPALYCALVLNFSYLLSGSMNINPQMILWSWLLLTAQNNAGQIGIDGWFFSPIKKRVAGPAKPPM